MCPPEIPTLLRQLLIAQIHILPLVVVHSWPNNYTGALSGNRHYSTGTIEGQLYYCTTVAVLHTMRPDVPAGITSIIITVSTTPPTTTAGSSHLCQAKRLELHSTGTLEGPLHSTWCIFKMRCTTQHNTFDILDVKVGKHELEEKSKK